MRRAGVEALAWAAIVGCSSPHGTTGATSGTGGSDASTPPAWQVVYDATTLGGAVLAAWGSGPSDVYAVGGPLGDTGFSTVAVHFDGRSWTKLAPGGSTSFWWVHGSSATDLWMVGESGRITHYDGKTFVDHAPLTTATMFGVWASSPREAWAVGGTPEGGTAQPNDVVLHWDGTSWTPETLPGAPLGRALYKVWGTSPNDLYVVGESATIWHRRGSTWTLEQNAATSTLFTVFGCSATEVYAVGGADVLRSAGDGTWSAVTIALGNTVSGVACNPGAQALVVGYGGLKQRLVGGAWQNDFKIRPWGDLHSAWADGAGGFWAVGGDFASPAAAGKAREGIIARYGAGSVPDLTP